MSFESTLGKRITFDDVYKVTSAILGDGLVAHKLAINTRKTIEAAYQRDRTSLQGKLPMAIVAGAVYLAGILYIDPPPTQNDVFHATKMSITTIRNRYKMLVRILGLQHLLNVK